MRPVTLEEVDAYFVREGIHTYREILQLLEDTEEELEQVETQRDEANAALAVERDRAGRASSEAVHQFLDAIPERIVTVSGRGGLREFAATWR